MNSKCKIERFETKTAQQHAKAVTIVMDRKY